MSFSRNFGAGLLIIALSAIPVPAHADDHAPNPNLTLSDLQPGANISKSLTGTTGDDGDGRDVADVKQSLDKECAKAALDDRVKIFSNTVTSVTNCNSDDSCVSPSEKFGKGFHFDVSYKQVITTCRYRLPGKKAMEGVLDTQRNDQAYCRDTFRMLKDEAVAARGAFHKSCAEKGLSLSQLQDCKAGSKLEKKEKRDESNDPSDFFEYQDDQAYPADLRIETLYIKGMSDIPKMSTSDGCLSQTANELQGAIDYYEARTSQQDRVSYSAQTLANIKIVKDAANSGPTASLPATGPDWSAASVQ